MTHDAGLYLYEQDGRTYIPTDLARGPWAPRTQNGAMIAGLLGSVLDNAPTPLPMIPMELHITLLKPVPFEPITLAVSIVREGRKLQVLNCALTVNRTTLASATLIRLRATEDRGPIGSVAPNTGRAPEQLSPYQPAGSPFFEFLDCRPLRGGFNQLEPGAIWLRPRGALIAGKPNSRLGLNALCADAGSGLSAVVPRQKWSYPNVSLSIHTHRLARGSWLLLESQMETEGHGVAQVSSLLSDETGQFGRVNQSVILERVAP